MPLPNVVAVTPKVVRPFLVPKQRSLTVAAPIELQDAPNVTAADLKPALPLPALKPKVVRPFLVPTVKAPEPPPVAPLQDAPNVTAGEEKRSGPQVGTPVAALIGLPAMAGAAPGIPVEPPVAAGAAGTTAEASLAIVGLNPAKTTEVPASPASRAAGFSAGPEPRAEGGTGANGMALLNVPGLVVKGGAKDTQPTLMAPFSPTSQANLLAAARGARGAAPKVPVEPSAPRVAEAPDARFAGRVVYAVAIQMPNVTSFSGSWLVWFAERAAGPEGTAGAAPRQMRPPEVLRKVDPKYIAAAAAERVEGTVRIFAVIGKDGHVGGISLLRQLDERLDRSAQEALAKWEFTPARRDGIAVDVDAIFEIPFHLAPRPKL
jgi:TonB family protein